MKKNIHSLVYGALIAALYAGLTYLSSFFGLAYGPIQVRISEALCILTVFFSDSRLGTYRGLSYIEHRVLYAA